MADLQFEIELVRNKDEEFGLQIGDCVNTNEEFQAQITHIDEESLHENLQVGDIVTAIDGKAVHNAEEVAHAMKDVSRCRASIQRREERRRAGSISLNPDDPSIIPLPTVYKGQRSSSFRRSQSNPGLDEEEEDDEESRRLKAKSLAFMQQKRPHSPPSPPVHLRNEKPPVRRRKSHDNRAGSPKTSQALKQFVDSVANERRRSSAPSLLSESDRDMLSRLASSHSLEMESVTPISVTQNDDTPTNSPVVPQLSKIHIPPPSVDFSTETEADYSDCSEGNPNPEKEQVMRDRWRRVLTLKRFCRVFERKSYPWVQLAGHKDAFKRGEDRHFILKQASANEEAAFEYFKEHESTIFQFVPTYGGIVEVDELRYIKLSNLLDGLFAPRVMDVKVGLRTFLESSVAKQTKRKDLLKKMDDIDPSAATPEERENGVSKLRYMMFREQQSSSSNLGFRIEAISVDGEQNKGFKTLKSRSDIALNFEYFTKRNAFIRDAIVKQLESLRSYLTTSTFFKTHEIVGSSILMVIGDDGTTRLAMIDFGKTVKRDVEIKHDVPWVPGTNSYEDGYLIGLDNIIAIMKECKCNK